MMQQLRVEQHAALQRAVAGERANLNDAVRTQVVYLSVESYGPSR